MMDIQCPVCGAEGEAEEWQGGECPGKCGNDYYWDEVVADDYSDYWGEVYWSYYSREKMKK